MAEHEVRKDGPRVRSQVVGAVASILRWVGTVFVVLLTSHVVLTVFAANPGNGITKFVRSWAEPLSLGFRDLFTPEDTKLRVLANFGLAAIFWLVVTSIVVRLVRRLG